MAKDTKTILAIGAHMDDVWYGVGGFALTAVRKGHRVVFINTVGDYSNWPTTQGREAEIKPKVRAFAEDRGIELRSLNYKYEYVPDDPECMEQLAKHCDEIAPNILFYQWFDDTNRDHWKTGVASAYACGHPSCFLARPARGFGQAYAYQLDAQCRNFVPGVYYDITDTLPDVLGGQWQYSVPDLKALLADRGLEAESIDVFGSLKGARGAEIIKRRVDFAAELGAQTIVLGCGHDAHDEPRKAACYALLRDVADYAAPRNIRIALEIHGGIMANAHEALRTMKEVDRPNVGVNFDTANILFYNDALDAAGAAKELEALAGHVRHVHLKDFIRGKTKKEHILPRFGEGEVDFRKVFDILHAAGFYGPFSFEVETFHHATVSDDIADYQEDLLASIDYIRSLGEFAS